MTPPSSILSSERDRSSAIAWGTLCVLAVVQMSLALKLLVTKNTAAADGSRPVVMTMAQPAAPVFAQSGMPHMMPSGVPEIGQISLPQPVVTAPPLPGSLVAEPMAASVSNAPPPIGSFTQPGMAMPGVPTMSGNMPTMPGTVLTLPGTSGMGASVVPSLPQAPLSSSMTGQVPTRVSAPSTASRPQTVPKAVATTTTQRMPLPGTQPNAMATRTPAGNAAPRTAAPPQAAPGFVAEDMPAPISSVPDTPPNALVPPPAVKPFHGPNMNFPNEAKPAPAQANAAMELMRDVNYVVTAAKELRGMSDMQGVLELLRRADELNPDHPAIIAEQAQTYEQMGLAAKAMDAWRRIQLLGPTKAGSYYELASRRLGTGSAAVTAPDGAALGGGAENEKFLRLGACQAERDFKVNSGERYVLHVPIVRAGNRPINSKELDLEVFFFDRVNNVQVSQTIAPEPVETWQSSPVDWTGAGEELLDVVYHLPALSPAEIQQHGRRSYYGYMLRLYYNNKLQDVAAEPRDLLEFGSAPGAAPGGVNPLLPPVGR